METVVCCASFSLGEDWLKYNEYKNLTKEKTCVVKLDYWSLAQWVCGARNADASCCFVPPSVCFYFLFHLLLLEKKHTHERMKERKRKRASSSMHFS